ncbi:MAG: hypothetical protein AAFR01_04640 [Pseudomonadota bacterium]
MGSQAELYIEAIEGEAKLLQAWGLNDDARYLNDEAKHLRMFLFLSNVRCEPDLPNLQAVQGSLTCVS